MKHCSLILAHSLWAIIFISSAAFAEPLNLTLAKEEVRKYHDEGLYEQEIAKKIAEAQEYISAKVQNNKHHQQLALVLDIDETSLSNYEHIANRDFVGTREQIHQEILAANAPAIKPTLMLYTNALRQGVKIFFVSGRDESERNATQNNLIKAGYIQWAGLYLRPNNYAKPSIIPFKSKAREAIEQKGYTIIASIGDQDSDLKGGHAEKGIKLPNPFYHLP